MARSETLRSWIGGAVLAVLLSGLAACGGDATQAPSPNRLSLELGGSHPVLRDVLVKSLRRTRAERSKPITTQPRQVVGRPRRVTPRQAVLESGESLSQLSARTLGSASRWTEIAELNGITDPNRVPSGSRLRLPPD